MNRCVPCASVWDEFSERLTALSHLDLLSTSGKTDQLGRRKPATAEQHAHVPNHDPDKVNWVEGHLEMPGENDRGRRHVFASEVSGVDKERFLDAIRHDSVPAMDVPLGNLPFHEDEMLSFLQYPLEDSLDRTYCSELFGEAPNSHLHLSSHQMIKENENSPGSQALGSLSSSECTAERKPVTADKAMALGAGRAAGILPQTGAHAFSKVRTSLHPKASPNALPTQLPPPNKLPSPAFPSTSHASAMCMPSQVVQSPMLNFPQFSRPAAATKTGLQFLGTSSGLTNIARARQALVTPEKGAFASSSLQSVGTFDFPTNIEGARQTLVACGKEVPALCIPSTTGSTTTVAIGTGSSRQSDVIAQERETRQCTSRALRGQCLSSMLLCRQDVDGGKDVELGNQLAMNFSESSVPASEKGTGTLETADLTSSPSRGSGNSTEKSAKEAAVVSLKKRTRSAEAYEYQSEDMEEVVANAKKPSRARTCVTKRTRAAEIHNQSERRRRDKINERMKALQELIPNANKTDKASMLDEAIEYLKLLQAQLQFMSMRTGMVLPPMMIPSGMQYLPMQRMPTVAHMGMGMSMGMGVGMGMDMMDASAAGASTGCAVVTLPRLPGHPLSGHAYPVVGFQSSNAPSVIHEAQGCMQASRVDEVYNMFPAQQQQESMHLNMQMNGDMYNDFMHQQQQTREC